MEEESTGELKPYVEEEDLPDTAVLNRPWHGELNSDDVDTTSCATAPDPGPGKTKRSTSSAGIQRRRWRCPTTTLPALDAGVAGSSWGCWRAGRCRRRCRGWSCR